MYMDSTVDLRADLFSAFVGGGGGTKLQIFSFFYLKWNASIIKFEKYAFRSFCYLFLFF